MRSRRVAMAFVLVMMLAGAACSGPNIPLKVGVKEFPTDVILGNQALLPPPAPPPSGNLEPGFPVIVPPSPVQIIDEAGPPDPCPAAGEFDAPALAAEGRAFDPPKEATYVYRNSGGFLEVGPSPSNGSFPEISTRSIVGVQVFSTDTFTYAIVSKVGAVTTTTQYLVITTSNDVPVTAPYGSAGMYVTQIVTQSPTGTDSFTPTPPLKILEFPIQAGATWTTYGVDGSRGTSMGWTARIGREVPDGEDEEREGGAPVNVPPAGIDMRQGNPAFNPDTVPKVRVNACGKVIDAWYITITDGTFVDAANTKSQSFRALYKFAPQFGGIFVGESVHTDGFEGEAAFVHNFESTINDVPAVP